MLLTITVDGKLTSDPSSISCVFAIHTSSIPGFTGSQNNNKEQDDYEFYVWKGDEVTVTLKAERSIRQIGNQVKLSICDQSIFDLLNESSNGEIPIKIKVTLPETMK